MATEVVDIVSEAQWLSERVKDVTSTEVSALYGLSPYTTEFELWHRKKGGVNVSIAENERMTWGKRLEEAIARGVAEDQGWTVRKVGSYMRNPEVRLGASFDFEIMNDDRGLGLMEVKNVDGHVFSDQWVDSGAGVEAPPHIELQLQAQMEVSDRKWGVIVALVGGNKAVPVMRERDRDIGASMRKHVAKFWRSIASGEMPQPDYEKDAKFIRDSLRRASKAGEVLAADAALDELIEHYALAQKERKSAEEREEVAKAEILMRAGTASVIASKHGKISCGTTADSLGKIVTADMVGTFVGARKGYRQFRLSPAKD